MEASSSLDDMVNILGLIKDLVPEKVVAQARRAPCPKSARAAPRSLFFFLHPHGALITCQVRAYEAAVLQVAAEKAQAAAASAPAPGAS